MRTFFDDEVMDYGFWEPRPLPAIPERSRLFSLSPIGRGTSQIICLTSYMSGLADTHNLSVGAMFNWDTMSVAASRFPQRLVQYGDGARKRYVVGDSAYDLNGLSLRAEQWVRVLEQVTLASGLQELTMLPFRQLFSELGLLRTHRAWCSECYEADRKNGTLYDRLIWCLRVVQICPIHHKPLLEKCPFCGKTASHLAANYLAGYCSSCEMWLGASVAVQRDTGDVNEFDKYASATVADMLESVQTEIGIGANSESLYSRHLFSANLRKCIHHLSGGVVLAFAEATGVGHQTLIGWLEKGTSPSLPGFLSLTFALGKAAHKVLLSSEMSKADIEEIVSSSGSRFQTPKKRRSTSAVREVLLDELRRKECRSLQSVAESLGYSSTSTLYQADAGLCRLVSERHWEKKRASSTYQRPNERKYSDQELESALSQALLEEPPPSPKDIANRLGYSGDHAIRYRFPNLTQKVIQRRNQWEKSQRKIRRKVLLAAISEVPPPSIYELSSRHGQGFSKFLLNQETDLVEKLKNAIESFEQKHKDEIDKALKVALLEMPAPSMRDVASRLGLRVEQIRKFYPYTVAKIAERSRNHRSEQFSRKREALDKEVLKLAAQLGEAGIAPRYDCIIPLLSADSLFKWDEISRAIQKARHTLGLEPAKPGPVSERAKSGSIGRKGPQKAGKENLVEERTLKAVS